MRSGKPISHLGVLYMDFHPRESKRQGAWCGTYRSHHIFDGKTVTPVVTVVCNFTRAAGDTPALLSMDEVNTIFHEFGHALASLMNKNSYNTSFVAWDFVELPYKLMGTLVTEPEVLNIYARHYKTGEVIPGDLVAKIKNSGYFNQGFENVEYLAASFLDMAYYTLQSPVSVDVQSFEKEYFNKLGLIPEIISRYRSTYFLLILTGLTLVITAIYGLPLLDYDAFGSFQGEGYIQ